MLNHSVFQNIQNAQKHILVVTKYWDSKTTKDILDHVESKYAEIFSGLWENRIEQIINKNLPREKLHFIGNIQSKKIPEIVKYCSVIHSLSSLKHAQKIESLWIPTQAFIQINLDPEKDIGIPESELWNFLKVCKEYKNLEIIGISGMGSGDFTEATKRKEFQKLIELRDTYIPHWLISAGTSRDYEIALEEWVDIVRVGQKTQR